MSLSNLPLSYCTNVHPGVTVAEVERGLAEFTVPAQRLVGEPIAAGLWLAASVIRELHATPDGTTNFARQLADTGLTCHTLNAFPYGDFHSTRVKENVYIPDWTRPERLDYTVACARVLAELLPADRDGSISTVPLGFKQLPRGADFEPRCIQQLLELSRQLGRLEQQTGRLVRLAIEPEPLCVLETTDEAISFFQRLWREAEQQQILEPARRHLGLCYDVCHQAVEFEDVARSVRDLDDAGVRINKVHISCAIHLDDPRDDAARTELASYVEPRYLHQTFAKARDGRVLRELDLSAELAASPPPAMADAVAWRIHFHVPVDAEMLGSLRTTRAELRQALIAVARLDYAPHLEVETYTWRVMPGAKPNLVEALARELSSTSGLLRALRP